MQYSLLQLADDLSLDFQGNANLTLTHCCGVDQLGPGGLTFITNPKELSNLPTPTGVFNQKSTDLSTLDSDAGAIIVPLGTSLGGNNLLFSNDPLLSHVQAMSILHPEPTASGTIHPSAVIAEGVVLGKNVTIDANVVLYSNVSIGDETVIRANTTIMENTSIGANCLLHANVSIRENCKLGDRVILHSGAVIGTDGYGYFQRDGKNIKIPQVGGVILGDDVEVGSNSCVDRARFYNTIVGSGGKLDNLVHIAHNVEIGSDALITAQCGVAGSSKIGHHLMMGGQSGIKDNLEVGNQVSLLARTLLTSKTQDGEVMAGMPSRPHNNWRREEASFAGLPKALQRLKRLEQFAKTHGFQEEDS